VNLIVASAMVRLDMLYRGFRVAQELPEGLREKIVEKVKEKVQQRQNGDDLDLDLDEEITEENMDDIAEKLVSLAGRMEQGTGEDVPAWSEDVTDAIDELSNKVDRLVEIAEKFVKVLPAKEVNKKGVEKTASAVVLMAADFTAREWRRYKRKHPNADKSKHQIFKSTEEKMQAIREREEPELEESEEYKKEQKERKERRIERKKVKLPPERKKSVEDGEKKTKESLKKEKKIPEKPEEESLKKKKKAPEKPEKEVSEKSRDRSKPESSDWKALDPRDETQLKEHGYTRKRVKIESDTQLQDIRTGKKYKFSDLPDDLQKTIIRRNDAGKTLVSPKDESKETLKPKSLPRKETKSERRTKEKAQKKVKDAVSKAGGVSSLMDVLKRSSKSTVKGLGNFAKKHVYDAVKVGDTVRDALGKMYDEFVFSKGVPKLESKTASVVKRFTLPAVVARVEQWAITKVASRKDKDLMSDTGGVSKGMDKLPKLKPPRDDCKKRWRTKRKTKEERDPDTDNDPDTSHDPDMRPD